MPSFFRKLSNFFSYVVYLVNTFIDVTNANDLILSLGLYVIYPAILFLLIDKFHGVCGAAFYLRKAEAIAANNSVFLPFTTLLRTSKLIHIIIYSVDADAKSGSQRDLEVVDSEDEVEDPRRAGNDGALLGKLKCQTWMQLSQELGAVGIAALLLLFCLPVLAFWFMFLHILLSAWTLYSLLKRLWKDSQDSSWGQGSGNFGDDEEGDNGGDVEFQEFLSNFGEDDENKQ